MKFLTGMGLTLLAACALPLAGVADPVVTHGLTRSPVKFSDGSVAMQNDHCSAADLCATLQYPGGDTLQIYSQGIENCKQVLYFTRVHAQDFLFAFSRGFLNPCNLLADQAGPSEVLLDGGEIALRLSENRDGTLNFSFVSLNKN
jgi:hypothetical protein